MNNLELIFNPKTILIIVVAIMLLGRFFFRLKYLDFLMIVKKHYECFKNEDQKYNLAALLIYTATPVLLAIALAWMKDVNSETVNIITIIISILTAMLFTLLALIVDMRQKIRSSQSYSATEASLSSKLLRETYYSVMFEILISICILIMSFVCIFSDSYSKIESFLLYWLTFTLFVNLFIILKRIFNVIDREMNSKE